MAKVLRGNVIASLPWSWISNPLTTLPIWYSVYRLGVWLIPGQKTLLSQDEIAYRLSHFDQMNWSNGLFAMFDVFLDDLLAPLWLGATVLGIAMAIPGFIAIYIIVIAVRRRRAKRREHLRSVFRVIPGPKMSSDSFSGRK